MSWFVHENNIQGKIRQNYKRRGIDFKKFKNKFYLPYKKQQLAIKGIEKKDISTKIELLEKYYINVGNFNTGNWITFQSKFRPTILEEFCGYLFKDLPQIKSLGLDFFKRGIYAGMRISSEGNVDIETRDIDFCITKLTNATIGSSKYELKIPLIAIECKTYLDKTMFSGAQFTAQKLKGGTPRVKVFMVTERNEVNLREIPSDSPIDQIFVLRNGGPNPVDFNTIWDFFCEVKDGLKRITHEQLITLPGKLFPK